MSPESAAPSPEEAVAAISRWLSVESPTHHAAGVNRMMDLVADEAEATGIPWERIGGTQGLGDSLILRAGPRTGEPALLVLSHLDTVHPVGTLAELPVRVEGDRLYGPGVYDMKGGAWLCLQGFIAAAKGGQARRPLVFLFTSDEEIGSPTTRGLIEDLGRRAEAVLVTEPGRDGGRVVTGRKGVGRFDIHVEGRPAHAGSRHAEGRNAIREAARLILEIEALTDYARGITTTVGLVQGGTAENVVPQHCRFTADLRVVTEEDGRACVARLRGLQAAPDFTVTVTGGMNRPPYPRSDLTGRLFAQARAIAEQELGLALGEVPLTGGGSDGNFTAALGVPTLDGLGIDGDGAHTLWEYGLISSIAPRRRLMQRMLETL
ncbi:peptidase dimerisation domain protein [Methylobacterium sp. 4-46]|uniref:M20 family metallopeptidase n=1 Tax=unclassified Methylobacterium TaxID=2615210 RepID=UPI000165CC1A|nr:MULTISPECIES: M20 family metallopeptidase [Methylobacterium]ACA19360.1 peptidase dimerisation domain protein [Methylobacterium sp. 4-46]WFT78559.1 M20 family metallopeptidase [Methylobacterium nodulans]